MLSLSDDHVFGSILGPWPLAHGAALGALPADDVILGQAVGSDTLLLVVLILAVVAFLSLAGVFAARYESRQIAPCPAKSAQHE